MELASSLQRNRQVPGIRFLIGPRCGINGHPSSVPGIGCVACGTRSGYSSEGQWSVV